MDELSFIGISLTAAITIVGIRYTKRKSNQENRNITCKKCKKIECECEGE